MTKEEKKLIKEEKKKLKQESKSRKFFSETGKRTRGFFADFKKFISKGNIIDLAVAVVIGNAFSKIVSSLVKDIIMPLIGWAFGKESLSELSVTLRPETAVGAGDAILWNYGAFIQAIVDFLIIAFFIFVVLKLIMNAQNGVKKIAKKAKKGQIVEEENQVEPAPVETQEDILREIRDLLKAQNKAEAIKSAEKLEDKIDIID